MHKRNAHSVTMLTIVALFVILLPFALIFVLDQIVKLVFMMEIVVVAMMGII